MADKGSFYKKIENALKEKYPDISDKALYSILVNVQIESVGGTKNREVGWSSKNIEKKRKNNPKDYKSIIANYDRWIASGHTPEEYDALETNQAKLGVMYHGDDKREGFAGGMGLIQFTDLSGMKSSDKSNRRNMLAVAKELGLSEKEAVAKMESNDLDFSIAFTLGMMEKNWNLKSSDDVNKYQSPFQFRNKVNPGEPNKDKLALINHASKIVGKNYTEFSGKEWESINDDAAVAANALVKTAYVKEKNEKLASEYIQKQRELEGKKHKALGDKELTDDEKEANKKLQDEQQKLKDEFLIKSGGRSNANQSLNAIETQNQEHNKEAFEDKYFSGIKDKRGEIAKIKEEQEALRNEEAQFAGVTGLTKEQIAKKNKEFGNRARKLTNRLNSVNKDIEGIKKNGSVSIIKDEFKALTDKVNDPNLKPEEKAIYRKKLKDLGPLMETIQSREALTNDEGNKKLIESSVENWKKQRNKDLSWAEAHLDQSDPNYKKTSKLLSKHLKGFNPNAPIDFDNPTIRKVLEEYAPETLANADKVIEDNKSGLVNKLTSKGDKVDDFDKSITEHYKTVTSGDTAKDKIASLLGDDAIESNFDDLDISINYEADLVKEKQEEQKKALVKAMEEKGYTYDPTNPDTPFTIGTVTDQHNKAVKDAKEQAEKDKLKKEENDKKAAERTRKIEEDKANAALFNSALDGNTDSNAIIIKDSPDVFEALGNDAISNMVSLASAVTGGIMASTDVPTDDELVISSEFLEHVDNLKTLSEIGLDPVEEAAMVKDLTDGYAVMMENAVRASGGNKGAMLGAMSVADANRSKGMMEIQKFDVQAKRDALDKYGAAIEKIDMRRTESNRIAREREYKEAILKKQTGAKLMGDSIKNILDSINYQQNEKPIRDAYAAKLKKDIGAYSSQLDADQAMVNNKLKDYYGTKAGKDVFKQMGISLDEVKDMSYEDRVKFADKYSNEIKKYNEAEVGENGEKAYEYKPEVKPEENIMDGLKEENYDDEFIDVNSIVQAPEDVNIDPNFKETKTSNYNEPKKDNILDESLQFNFDGDKEEETEEDIDKYLTNMFKQ